MKVISTFFTVFTVVHTYGDRTLTVTVTVMVTVTVTVTAVSHRHDSFSPFFTVLHMAFFMVTSPHFHRLFTVFSRYGDYFRLFENCSPRISTVRDGMSGVLSGSDVEIKPSLSISELNTSLTISLLAFHI